MDVMAFGKKVVERRWKKVRKESACGGREKQNKTKLEETPKDLKFFAIPGVKICLV